MQEDTVVAAVRQLRVEGQRVTLRAVHAITGGSHRDLTRLLRGAKEFLADDEVADLDEEAVESSPRPSGFPIVLAKFWGLRNGDSRVPQWS